MTTSDLEKSSYAAGVSVPRIARKWFWMLGMLVLAAYVPSLFGWFYGDDAVTLTDAAGVLEHPWAALGPGTFGRFRPLRLGSLALLYAMADTRTGVPYHIFSLALHGVNVWLVYRLMCRLIPGDRLIPFAATAIMAVHWAGSEAVTYLSAIGILFSTTGALICCLAACRLTECPRIVGWPLLQLGAGMLVAIGGGYALAALPATLICAIWPRGQGRRASLRALVLTAAVLVPLVLAYGALETFVIARNLEQQMKFDPAFMLAQLGESIARLYLPSYFVNEPIVLGFLGVVTVVVVTWKPLRQTFAQPRVWMLFLLTLACLLPYAPSNLGNRNRFGYLPSAFFTAFLLLLTVGALQRWSRTPALLLRIAVPVCLATFLAINIAGMEVRVFQALRRGEAFREFVAKIERLKQGADSDGRELRLYMTTVDPEQCLYMLRLNGILTPVETIHSAPLLAPIPNELRVLVAYSARSGFDVTVQPPGNSETKPDTP